MTITLSSKGQIVIPSLLRSKLQLFPGAKFECEIKDDMLILKPQSKRVKMREHVVDPVTGLRVTKRSKEGIRVTSEMVKALLADFP